MPPFGHPCDFAGAPLAAVLWNPAAPALLLGLLFLAMAASVLFAAKRLRARCGARKSLPILAARTLVLLLVFLALLDPSCRVADKDATPPRIRILMDRSASMDVPDGPGAATRADRADAFVESLRAALPRHAEVEVVPFDSSVADAVAAAADQEDGQTAFVLATDGGDGPIRPARIPRAPVAVLGLGTDSDTWDNVRIARLEAPGTAEQDALFTLEATLEATGSRAFLDRLDALRVSLEIHEGRGVWSQVDEQAASLAGGTASLAFSASRSLPGPATYRVRIDEAPGELSPLDNARGARVEIRRDILNVLYFSCRLGADLKMLRQELSADPAIAFTAAYRVGGARFAVQGDDPERTKLLEGGLPESAALLRRFDCILLGSFAADALAPAQEAALLDYVDGGGGLLWLGGEESFEGGGYERSSLEPLFPWRMTGEGGTLRRGDFPVSLPAAAAMEPAVAGLGELLARCAEDGEPLSLESVNAIPALKPAAQLLLQVETPEGRAPLAAMLRTGAGRSGAVASNTSWLWARKGGAPAAFYRRFWRQMVRAAAGRTEGGQHLHITWNPAEPRPGSRLEAHIRVDEPEGVSLRAAIRDDAGEHALPVLPGESPGRWIAAMDLPEGGTRLFRLSAERGGEPLDAFEKRFDLTPLQEEGWDLSRKDAALRALAAKTSGAYRVESGAGELAATVAAWCRSTRRERRAAATASLLFPAILLAACIAEWALRRKCGIV
ncbi:MAG: hypothetical protein ACOX5G_07455 [Kiritimatiellia bacterium]|jgi:hypothetical protein